MKKNDEHYYRLTADLQTYPDDVFYFIIGGRNTGKTYSSLKYCYQNQIKFCFLKRTMEDVDLLCTGSGRIGSKEQEFGIDLSPFKSINRDYGTNVKAHSIKKGLGGFWDHDAEGIPVGGPIGYILALNAVSKYKGFDLSDVDIVIFDEFIPNVWDRVQHREGEQLLDLLKTIMRDREHRGKEPLKLICLANATSASNPIMNMFEITDEVIDMQLKGLEFYENKERRIFVHLIKNSEEFDAIEKESALFKSMGDTQWGQMAFGNNFGYNDVTNVGKLSIKGFTPVCSVKHKRRTYYIYMKDGFYYMTTSRASYCNLHYDLNLENDQKRFFNEILYDFKEACINNKMLFQSYSMYDLIINYKNHYKI